MIKKNKFDNKVMPPVSTEEYLNEIKDIDEAIKIALDTRKFEIGLYWKRSTYFWAFLVSAFGAFGFVCSMSDNTRLVFDRNLLLVLVSAIGILLSFCFYLVNRGSKYWQENWETQIDILLKNKIGPVFQRVKNPNYVMANKNIKKCFGLLESYPFSVSKVNTLLSLLMIIVWIILFFVSVGLFFKTSVNQCFNNALCVFIIIVTFLFVSVLIKNSKGFAADSAGYYDENQKLLKRKIDFQK